MFLNPEGLENTPYNLRSRATKFCKIYTMVYKFNSVHFFSYHMKTHVIFAHKAFRTIQILKYFSKINYIYNTSSIVMNLKRYGHFKWHFWFKISFTEGGFLLIYSRNEIFSNFCSIKAIHYSG